MQPYQVELLEHRRRHPALPCLPLTLSQARSRSLITMHGTDDSERHCVTNVVRRRLELPRRHRDTLWCMKMTLYRTQTPFFDLFASQLFF